MTFWDHLEELRHVLLRCISVIALFAILAFVFKDEVFAIIFAPKSPNFLPRLFGSSPDIRLINTELTRQFIIHMMTSFHVGLIVAAPYIIYELYRFHLPWPLRKRAALFHAARRLCLCHVYGRHTFSVISLVVVDSKFFSVVHDIIFDDIVAINIAKIILFFLMNISFFITLFNAVSQ